VRAILYVQKFEISPFNLAFSNHAQSGRKPEASPRGAPKAAGLTSPPIGWRHCLQCQSSLVGAKGRRCSHPASPLFAFKRLARQRREANDTLKPVSRSPAVVPVDCDMLFSLKTTSSSLTYSSSHTCNYQKDMLFTSFARHLLQISPRR